VRWDEFVNYTVFIKPILGKTIGNKINFEIAGYEKARIYINIDKWKVDLILQNILYILGLDFNSKNLFSRT